MSARLLEWDCVSSPASGEIVSGDRAVMRVDEPHALAVVIDGLGHGAAAAAAADAAAQAIDDTGWSSVDEVANRCHAALRGTRGAAVSLACVDGDAATLTWLGVGNVEGRLVRAAGPRRAESLLTLPGVPGHALPPLRSTTLALERGDVLVLATDGVAPGFADALDPRGTCGDIATRILAGWRRISDDALVLVARYLGAPS